LSSTNVAGDLITQQPDVTDDEIDEVIAAALRVLDIDDVTTVSMDIESFILPAEGEAPESRGRITLNPNAGTFAPFDASTLDERILNAQSGVVVTRVSYKYTPLQLRFLNSEITLKETFFLKPRRSDFVQIQDGEDSEIRCAASHFSNVTCSDPGR